MGKPGLIVVKVVPDDTEIRASFLNVMRTDPGAAENIENKAIDGQRRRNLSQFSAPMAFMAAKR
jgi:hypothetical protein